MALLPQSFLNNPRAYMGFAGFVKIGSNVIGGTPNQINGNSDGAGLIDYNPYTIRATSADINLTQEITKPDVVDSRYDRSVYQLGPQLVDGSISFPVVYEVPTNNTLTLFEVLYRLAVTRDDNGGISPFDMEVRYDLSGNADFVYTGCIVNTWKFAVAQSDVVTCDFDIIGVGRKPATIEPPTRSDTLCTGSSTGSTDSFGATRIVTWNDARVEMQGGRLGATGVGGQFVRTFECNINNDAERFYSLNTVLAPQHVAPRKRDVTGSMTLIGRVPLLSDTARTNELHCTESSTIKFGYRTESGGEGCSDSTFNVILPNVVFEIETMSLVNDIFESTVNWHSLPAAGTGVCDPLLEIGSAVFDYAL
jgi:hypothetical protein